MILMKESMLSLKEKHNTGFSYFILLRYFMTDPLDIIFDDFGILLLGYMIEFNCLYIPQEHY